MQDPPAVVTFDKVLLLTVKTPLQFIVVAPNDLRRSKLVVKPDFNWRAERSPGEPIVKGVPEGEALEPSSPLIVTKAPIPLRTLPRALFAWLNLRPNLKNS